METALPKPEQPESSEVVEQSTKPKKEKKAPTPAQQAAREKGLQAMMAKRKELAKKQNEKKEEVKKAKKIVEEKIIKEDLGFVTKQDFESMRGSLMSLTKELGELRALTSHKPAEVEKPKERVVERVIERVPTAPAQAKKLTGYELLDKLFLDK